jgi:hypothetical protein
MKSKRGAIELSMTTIIVIVLGVMLLGLGIGWITGLFSQIEDLTQQSFAKAQQTIQEDMPSGDTFYIAGFSFEARAGKYSEIYTGIQFFGEEGETKEFSIEVGDPQYQTWFVLPTAVTIVAGEKKGIPIGVRVPAGTAPNLYSITLTKVESLGTIPSESEIILLEVK